ncbi:MAG: rRNA (cytidine1402-2-O)-methyltransferase [Bacteroidales bacterium]|jgi:16S rRNA (cytidine1402-2'-O)-methyltransferase|nr:rRNA (cytidine1402-2-O)-methyltransferase [Bacteroidales bacterium]MDN5328404.1 rRNA (cytidine1402-2-O)-methyltransferase [Bacteroidales bacterium]
MSKLFVVPTPIGNLEDITLRALRILKEVGFILAEDTRTSGILLKHYQISTPLVSHHKFNEHKTLHAVVQRIKSEESAALISDAGTPGISDPGYLLVRECLKENIPVECLPGATAFVPALVESGIPCDRFRFEGFLPQKKGRKTRLLNLSQETLTMVFYESPFRITRLLEELAEFISPDRIASVSREISKVYHETVRGSLSELITWSKSKTMKGEFVIVVEGKNQADEK